MSRTALPALLTLLTLAILARPADAQIRFDGIDGSAGFFGWAGDAFADVQGGPRFAVAPLFRVGEHWSFGVEGNISDAELQLQRDPLFIDGIGAGAIARRTFGDRDALHAFAGARAGWTRLESEKFDTETGELLGAWDQSGWLLGVEAGLEVPTSRYVDIVWAVGVGTAQFAECNIFGPDDQIVTFGESCSGVRWGVRAGIIIGRDDG